MSREAVARSTGIHLSSITRWEVRGVPNAFSRHDAQQLAHALDVSADWILDEQLPPGPSTEAVVAGCTLRSELLAAGKRARMRREHLGIARSRLALQLQVRDRVLSHWENDGVPHTVNPDQVAAWEKALKVAPGWLLGEQGAPMRAEPGAADEAQAIRSAAEIIVAIGRTLATGRKQSTVERNAELFAMRYGIKAEGRTLAAVAMQHGITEGRACQILTEMRSNARDFPSEFADTFRAIDATAKRHLPCSAERLETVLRPLLGDGPSIEDAWRFARDYFATHLSTLEAHLYSAPDRSSRGDERARTVRELA